jgi:hypothetical protein
MLFYKYVKENSRKMRKNVWDGKMKNFSREME